ncbi:MAG: hypothetical protein J5783_03570 [Lachnospiraceae bacterium]|nr:hypothetical protein [Lachnospiraceae bacterium]
MKEYLLLLPIIAAIILMNVNLALCHRLFHLINAKIKDQEAKGELHEI